jgi:hypothetical protein
LREKRKDDKGVQIVKNNRREKTGDSIQETEFSMRKDNNRILGLILSSVYWILSSDLFSLQSFFFSDSFVKLREV